MKPAFFAALMRMSHHCLFEVAAGKATNKAAIKQEQSLRQRERGGRTHACLAELGHGQPPTLMSLRSFVIMTDTSEFASCSLRSLSLCIDLLS